MYRVLLTGMSGVGKSTLTHAMAARGYKAVDVDCDEYSQWITLAASDGAAGEPLEVDRDWVWREDRIQTLLATEDADVLILSGCASNMGRFLLQFDQIVLLHAPTNVLIERLQTRINNQYGKHPAEVRRVIGLIEHVEPLLRKIAGHEIDTNAPLDATVTMLLQLIMPNETAHGHSGISSAGGAKHDDSHGPRI